MTPIIFRSGGAGQALLALHAFPLNSAMWTGQMEALATSASWLAPDLPGFAASAAAPACEDLDTLAATIYEALRARGVVAAVVAGCSMGGYLAFALLRVAPGFVRGLALINTKATVDPEPAKAKRLAFAQRVEVEGCGFLVDEWPPTALSPATIARQPEVVRSIQAMIRDATPRGVIAAQRAMAGRPDSTPLLGAVSVPTVVIHGLDDTFISEAESRAMCGAINGATFVGVPRAGHLPSLEQPALVNEALSELCAACERS